MPALNGIERIFNGTTTLTHLALDVHTWTSFWFSAAGHVNELL